MFTVCQRATLHLIGIFPWTHLCTHYSQAYLPPGAEEPEEEETKALKSQAVAQTLAGSVSNPQEFFGGGFDLEGDDEIENDFSFEQLRRRGPPGY